MGDPNNISGRFTSIQNAQDNDFTNGSIFVRAKAVNTPSMYDFAEPEGLRWNKSYPYQLLIVENTTGGWKIKEDWQFTLPIPPQTLNIDMPFAITTSATLGGVIEEHNGAPFRLIQLSGTTGILPLKGAPDPSLLSKMPAVTRTVLAGTVTAASTLVNDLTRGTITPSNKENVVPKSELESSVSSISRTSGYYQYHQLKQFFENYAHIKKTKDGQNLRLAFAMWKDQSTYLVTPVSFRTTRGVDSPLEYRYDITFKAWSRITLDSTVEAVDYIPASRNPNILASIINKVNASRVGLEDARKILEALRADIDVALFTPLREVGLSLKAISGFNRTLADYPESISKDFKESLLAYFPRNGNRGIIGNLSEELVKAITDLSELSGKAAVGTGRSTSTSDALTGAHPLNDIFNNPSDHYDLFSKIDPSSFRMPPALQRKIKEEEIKSAAFTRKDYEIRRDSVKSVLSDFCESVGAGSPTYTKAFNIVNRGSSVNKVATESDYEIMFLLNSVIIELNRLCVSNRMDPNKTDSIEYIAGLASKSGMAFTQPRSKFLVPLPYGHTLEQMSLMYLGEANRWFEIAALNGLREPYIDEVGFDLSLATNGAQNEIQIADVSNLFVGQLIFIASKSQKPEKRRITGIKNISGLVNVVYLDGDADLDKFTVIDSAHIHAYLPDTANSQMSIYIPSNDNASDADFEGKAIPGVDYFDKLVRVGGISLLLTQSNDIAFNSYGGTKLAVGMNNIIQKVRLALSTPKGSLLQHKNYGLPVQSGNSTADVSAKEILKSVQDMFSKDPTFSSILSASVLKQGPVSRITVSVEVAGVSEVIPVTADIRR